MALTIVTASILADLITVILFAVSMFLIFGFGLVTGLALSADED